ncbi:polysaccharide deacetylase family protein [Gracilibacillus massiliensis]|uniref:polysaccharide deacetylase family protein n=1 Tax=Gracilibacillus massiliensis TaxID=1564956 RepID=UPI0011DD62EC
MLYSLPYGYTTITFSDGPSRYTKEFVVILVEYNTKTTFFFMEKNIYLFGQCTVFTVKKDVYMKSFLEPP